MNHIAIKVENVTKEYSWSQSKNAGVKHDSAVFKALDNVSFEIRKGESVGIIGRNGSGKSTLFRIISRLSKPTHGRVYTDGKVASILEIGTGFHPDLSGRENISFNGRLLGISPRELKRKYNEIIEFSGIEKFIDEPVKNYSAGMYLRLAFSILAHVDADIILLDEVMNVGDAEFQLKSGEKIREFIDRKKTVVIISHNLIELSGLVKRFIRLEEGKIKDDGGSGTVMEKYVEDSYISTKKASMPVREVKPPYMLSKDVLDCEFIHVKNIQIFAQGKERTSEIHRDETLAFSISFSKKTMCDVQVGITVLDIGGNVILTTLSLDATEKIENEDFLADSVISGTIPPYFFNYGLFIFTFFFIVYDNNGMGLPQRFDVRDGIVVKINKASMGEVMVNNIPGYLRPQITWEYKMFV